MPDDIFDGLPRGDQDREYSESELPKGYFESIGNLAQIGFEDGGGDIFVGVVNGETEIHTRDDGRTERRTMKGDPIGISDDRHLITIAGSRSGKGRSAIIPNLLSYGGSILCLDVKGELASITANYRADKLDQNVCILDPFRIVNKKCDPHRKSFNPLSILHPSSHSIIEDAGLIADALIVSSNSEDAHWDETSRALTESVILHVISYYKFKDEEKTLVTVGDLILNTGFKTLLEQMKDNTDLEGVVNARAQIFAEKNDKELSIILSVTRRNLKFLDYDPIKEVLSGESIDLEDLKAGSTTVYLVLPALRMGRCAPWLRIFINLVLSMMERSPLPPPRPPLLMILDELPTLGFLKELEIGIGFVSGYGVKIWSIVQDLGQLKSLYKDRWQTFIGNSGIIQCFGNTDHFTSDWISKYLDKTTITVTEKQNRNRDHMVSQGASGNGEKEVTIDLLTAAEVRMFFARDDTYNRQLVIIPGKQPYITSRVFYDQHHIFEDRFDLIP